MPANLTNLIRSEAPVWDHARNDSNVLSARKAIYKILSADRTAYPSDKELHNLVSLFPELSTTLDDSLSALYSWSFKRTILFDASFLGLFRTGITSYWIDKLSIHACLGFPFFSIHGLLLNSEYRHIDHKLFTSSETITGLLSSTANALGCEVALCNHQSELDARSKSISHDLFLSSYYFHATSSRNLAVLYDFIPERLGWPLDQPIWRYKKHYIQNARSFISISRTTSNDILQFYPRESICSCYVSYCSVSTMGLLASTAVEGLRGKRFVVCVGMNALFEHKRLNLALRACEDLYSMGLIDCLVVTGPSAKRNKELALSLGVVKSNDWIIADMFSRPQLNWLYSKALCNLQTSVFEGFGYSPLEALAFECLTFFEDNEINREIYESLGYPVCWADTSRTVSKISRFILRSASNPIASFKRVCKEQLFRYSPLAQYLSWFGAIVRELS